jgi:MerR family transcriptional regulator, light-induced transcriptional regulator
MAEERFRIGELSRRVGASPELLRAWERRYGLLRPSRTNGGFRLYSEEDVARVRRMQQLRAEGLAASEAAQAAAREASPATPEPSTPLLEAHAADLPRALDTFDEQAAHWLLDRVLAGFQLETVMTDLLLPYLRDLGQRWARGEITVAQEHFASTLIRGRLLALAQGWDHGRGPRTLLACPPGEDHDLPLVMFGLALGRRVGGGDHDERRMH